MQRDTAIVALSRHHAATAYGVRIRRVIPHGIDVHRIPVGRGDGGYACFLGRMSPNKGAREAALVARQAGVPLRIAAKMREPMEREYFEEEVAPLLGGDIEYVGELGEREKLELLGDAIALVNPIRWPEPFGLVMIEALATGTPVLARPEGSAPEIVSDGRTGYLRDRLADLAVALLDVGHLDRGSCREEAEQRFGAARMVRDHLDLYETVVNEHRCASAAPVAH
jgi:glycosyltransferase involved in cell wall biosynthesis